MNTILNSKTTVTTVRTLLLLLFFVITSNKNAEAQSNIIEFDVLVENADVTSNSKSNITVTVNSNSNEHAFYLYNKLPHLSKRAYSKTEIIDQRVYVFTNLKAGTYYVCVSDKEENSSCKKVEVGRK